MLITERFSATNSATATANAACALCLRVGNEGDRLIPIPVGKLSLGSGPRCSVRLAYDGVQPLHCLITRDGDGLHVRRWADDILLNGVPFNEASLAAGDRLSIGAIELEVVGPPIHEESGEDTASPPTVEQQPAAEADTATVAASVSLSLPEATSDSVEWPTEPPEELLALSPPPSAIVEPVVAGTPSRLTRTRRRKLMSALRFHHQMGMQLERAVANLEQQMREFSIGQSHSMAEGVQLNSTLSSLVDQVREYRSEQVQFEQRHANWQEQSRCWESRLEEQQQRLQCFERESERSRTQENGMRRRGRKLVTSLRQGRDTFRTMDQRLAGLEQKSQEARADRDRLHEEMAKALEQQSAQETQAVAWNAVVDATDRLSNNYRQLVAENTRLASEIEKFAEARGELATEKAAASEMLAMVREQLKEQQQRQAEFDLQRGQWQEELRGWESRVNERDQWAERFESDLNGIRAALETPTVPIAEWKSLSEEVASLNRQQSETLRQRTLWEGRVTECETRLVGRVGRIEAVERNVEELRAATQEQASRSADWTALSGQIASLVKQQSEWENDRSAIRGRVSDCESRLADRLQQLGKVERQLEVLRNADQEQSTQAAGWTALAEQVAVLRNQQTEWDQLRDAWQGRVAGCETQFVALREQLASVEQEVVELYAVTSEPSIPAAEWTALSDQVTLLRTQQTEWEKLRDAWQGRVNGSETQFADLRNQLANVEQAISELFASMGEPSIPAVEWTALSEEVTQLRKQQAEWEKQRDAWQGRVEAGETRFGNLREQLTNVEQTVAELHAVTSEPSIPAAEWTALSEQVTELRKQQMEWGKLRDAWQGGVEANETQFVALREQLANIEQAVTELYASTSEPTIPTAEWTALSEKVTVLRQQQEEWEKLRDAWQGRVDGSETQFADLRNQLASIEHTVSELYASASEPSIPAAELTALSEQVASLRSQQAELSQLRTVLDARLQSYETQLATGAERFGNLEGEIEGLHAAHRDQATQVSELNSLFEQLAALQRQQVEFDQLRNDWQDRVSEWETQLQQRLRQFERFEGQLTHLHAAQHEQAAQIANLASQEYVGPPIKPPVDQPAAVHKSPECESVETAGAEPASDSEPVRPTAAPISYLERYAGMFEDDNSEGSAETRQSPSTPEQSRTGNRDESNTDQRASSEHHAGHGDEESVEQYMAKLMQRIRGESTGSDASPTSSSGEDFESKSSRTSSFVAESAEPTAATGHDPWSTVAIVDERSSEPLLTNVEELKPKTPAPQFAADMRALRALANQSTRHAIGVHTARKLRRNAVTRCVIAVLAIFAGLYLIVYAPSWQSVQFAGACVALFAALYWTKLTFGSLMRAIQVGAFQHFDDDEGEDPLHPPLPIDVDHKNDDQLNDDQLNDDH